MLSPRLVKQRLAARRRVARTPYWIHTYRVWYGMVWQRSVEDGQPPKRPGPASGWGQCHYTDTAGRYSGRKARVTRLPVVGEGLFSGWRLQGPACIGPHAMPRCVVHLVSCHSHQPKQPQRQPVPRTEVNTLPPLSTLNRTKKNSPE